MMHLPIAYKLFYVHLLISPLRQQIFGEHLLCIQGCGGKSNSPACCIYESHILTESSLATWNHAATISIWEEVLHSTFE